MKVLVSIPNRGWIHRQVFGTVFNMVAGRRHEIEVIVPIFPPPYDNALNAIAKGFYEGDYDYWLNIDDDNPPPSNALDLVDLDKDIIGFPTPGLSEKQSPMVHPMAFRIVDGKHVPVRDGKGLERVDAISSGAMLIHKRVFNKPEMRLQPFLSRYNEHGFRTHGPDICFCARARAAGLEIYSHFDYPSKHYKELDISILMGKL